MSTPDPFPAPPDDATPTFVMTPELQAQMAALTQQATAQLQALVAALRQFEESLPSPTPVDVTPIDVAPIKPPPADDDTIAIPYGAPVLGPPPIFLSGPDLTPPAMMPQDWQPQADPDMADPNMQALTRQAVANLKALTDALRESEGFLPHDLAKPIDPPPGFAALEIQAVLREVTDLMATSSNAEMLALLPVALEPPPASAAPIGAGMPDAPIPIVWMMPHVTRAGAEGGTNG